MSRIDPRQALAGSLLDRLRDEDPGNSRETARAGYQVLRDIHDSVRRDLENLLNTRQRCLAWPEDSDELEGSVVGYGIPDLTGENLSSQNNRAKFLRSIEDAIRRFEPRFQSVKVTPVENENEDRTVHFRIDALLHADPLPEKLVFDSSLEPTTRAFEVAL